MPAKGYDTYYAEGKHGLAVRISPGGTKTFFVYRKVNGRPQRVTIGRFPSVTVDIAFKRLDEINGQFATGEDPNAKKKKLRDEMRFGELFSNYIERYAKQHKKTWGQDKETYKRYLSDWDNKPISFVTRQDIERLHTKVGESNGKYAANRLLALLSIVFNKAADWGWNGMNPTAGIKKFKEKSRDRFLQSDELPQFFTALARMTNHTIRDYILMSLLTGARRSNVLAMRWKEINLDRGEWRMPDTKTGDSHTVPLVQAAIDILKTRCEQAVGEFVFPSNTSCSGHLMEPKAAWQKLLQEAGLQNVRLHDLRRTLGSWQAATGANLSVIGKTLAHKNVSTTHIYARLNLDPVRDSLNIATDAMLRYATTPN